MDQSFQTAVSGAYYVMTKGMAMTLDEYQQRAFKTANTEVPQLTEQQILLLSWSCQLAEEAGEILSLINKHVFKGHPLDLEKLGKEVGDAQWNVAAIATQAGLSLGSIGEQNLFKLHVRFGGGSFNTQDSIARRDMDATE